MNKVMLSGNVGQDPEVRYTASQIPVANFSLATRGYSKKGEEQKVDWHNVTVWDKLAEIVGKYVKKSTPVLVEGRIEYQQYESKTGEKKVKTIIVAQSVEWFGKRDKDAGESHEGQQSKPKSEADIINETLDDIPF